MTPTFILEFRPLNRRLKRHYLRNGYKTTYGRTVSVGAMILMLQGSGTPTKGCTRLLNKLRNLGPKSYLREEYTRRNQSVLIPAVYSR